MTTALDLRAGQLIETHNSYDLALGSDGYFCVRAGDEILYTRRGQFHRDANGHLATVEGYPLQVEGGGDLVLTAQTFSVEADGTVIEDGQATARVGVATAPNPTALGDSGALFRAADAVPAQAIVIRQGAVEASNVSLSDEMVAIMESLRRAEIGQRLVGLYDDLMGRVLTSGTGGGA